jgi:hypothetical protein
MTGRLRLTPLLGAVLIGVAVLPASAQSSGTASASMSVGVTVVRSCTVAAPAAAGPSALNVRLSCGRGETAALPVRGAVVPVAGAPAAASLDTTKNQHGLVVLVNF